MRLRAAAFIAVALVACVEQARAFNYQEHRAIVCNAIDAICANVGKMEGYAGRKELVQAYLCSPSCGAHPVESEVQALSLFRDTCALSFGDMVALIDYGDSQSLGQMTCAEVEAKAGDIIHYGEEALFADAHFCPRAPQSYQHFHDVAKAIALDAGRARRPQDQEDRLRLALLYEVQGLHYFTDNFSAGHTVARLNDRTDPLVTKKIHDYFNRVGRLVQNREVVDNKLSTWTAYGDGHLLDGKGVNARYATDAVEASLGSIVFTFLSQERVDDPAYNQLPSCPLVGGQDIPDGIPSFLLRHDFELRVATMFSVMDIGARDLRDTQMMAAQLVGVWPITSFLSILGGAEVSRWKPGRGVDEVRQSGNVGYSLRSVDAIAGVGGAIPIARYLKVVFDVNGRVSIGDIFATSPSMGTIGSAFDGFDVVPALEVPLLHLSIRVGAGVGARRSAVDQGWTFALGPYLAGAGRW